MLFNSGGFLAFMLTVWVAYWWLVPRTARWQNSVLLLAGLFFYGLSDLRFLIMLAGSALINHALALRLTRLPEGRTRTALFRLGIALNLGLLIYFKYLGFFMDGVHDLLLAIGLAPHIWTLQLALPLGISFYTFQMIGYLIDVQNEEIEPCTDRSDFLTYVFHFPKMLAGPIERAQHFLPQITEARRPDAELMSDGLRQVLWGLFAKVVIADALADHINTVFDAPETHGRLTLIGAVSLYIVQLYCDFSGYSNMALGLSKLLGIRLRINFAYPLFNLNIGEFWRRWHVSLTSWMLDYVFTPLSFVLRDLGKRGLVIAISVTFLAVGIWHGANWTFVVFGILQSLYFMPLVLGQGINRSPSLPTDTLLPSPAQAVRILLMFVLLSMTFALLRADSLHHMGRIYGNILINDLPWSTLKLPNDLLLCIVGLFLVEWSQRSKEHALQWSRERIPILARYAIYLLLTQLVIWKNGAANDFIYFQF